MKCLESLLLIISLLVLIPVNTNSQSIENPEKMASFAVGPLEIKFTGRSGQTLQSSFSIATRKYSSPRTFEITAMDLGQQSSGGTSPVERGKGIKSCAEWIKIENEVLLGPNDRKEIPFTIEVPYGLHGHYFAYIDVSTKPKRPDGQFAVLVKHRLPVRIELTIPGQAIMRLNAKDLVYQQGRRRENPYLLLKITNEGEWKTSITGDIVIREIGTQNQQVVAIPYNPITKRAFEIYPGIEIPLQCSLPNSLNSGKYTATVRMLLNQFGKSHAQFEFTVGSKPMAGQLIKKEEFAVDLEISPRLFELPLLPGATRHLTIRVKNNNNYPIDALASLKQATMEPNGSFTYRLETDSKVQNFIELNPLKLKIEPMRANVIKAKVSIPKDLELKIGSIHVLRVEAKSSNSETAKDGWESVGEQAIPIMIYNATSSPAKIKCSKFEIIQPSKDLNPTVGIFRVKNVGLKLAKIYGKMSLKGDNSKEYAYLNIGKGTPEFIMPGNEREFRFNIPTLDDGEFILSSELNIDNQPNNSLYEERSFTALAVKPEELK